MSLRLDVLVPVNVNWSPPLAGRLPESNVPSLCHVRGHPSLTRPPWFRRIRGERCKLLTLSYGLVFWWKTPARPPVMDSSGENKKMRENGAMPWITLFWRKKTCSGFLAVRKLLRGKVSFFSGVFCFYLFSNKLGLERAVLYKHLFIFLILLLYSSGQLHLRMKCLVWIVQGSSR